MLQSNSRRCFSKITDTKVIIKAVKLSFTQFYCFSFVDYLTFKETFTLQIFQLISLLNRNPLMISLFCYRFCIYHVFIKFINKSISRSLDNNCIIHYTTGLNRFKDISNVIIYLSMMFE